MESRHDPIRVLMVEDSPTIRRLISKALEAHPDIRVVGEATHPYEARELIKQLDPDVLTLDVELPHMNGIDFLQKIMTLRPMPVIMFSSLTQKGSDAAVRALSIGAVDCLSKTMTMATDGTLSALAPMIRMAARANVTMARGAAQTARQSYRNHNHVLLIGSSTGGVDALEQVLSRFPANCPPTLIAQHMPEAFLKSFVARLDQRFAPRIRLAENGEPLQDGCVYVAPGGDFHLGISKTPPWRCELIDGPKVSGHRPSVDVLFRSAVPLGAAAVAVILTGMGSDGAQGMLELRRAGARTLAQDEASSVVFGMPRVALENGGAEKALPLGKIADAALNLCAASSRNAVQEK